MNLKLFAGICAVGTVLFSCNQNSNQQKTGDVNANDTIIQVQHDTAATESLRLQPNGSKWKVNPPMMVHLKHIDKMIQAAGEPNAASLKALAKGLQTDLDLLTSSCDMEGEAHDVLHLWLVPFLELVASIEKGEQTGTAADQLLILQQSMATFHQYFE